MPLPDHPVPDLKTTADTGRLTVRLPRIHDRVSLECTHRCRTAIPPAELLSMQEAVAAGQLLSVSVQPDLPSSSVEVVEVRRRDAESVCVTVRALLVSRVTVYNECASAVLCTFRRVTELFDSARLRLPAALSAKHVHVRPLSALCEPLSATPFDGKLTICDTLIQELTAEDEIIAEIAILGSVGLPDGVPCRDALQ